MCGHKKGSWRKWTLNSSQGRNGHCFLPSAGKTKWLRTASASADHSLNMDVFFTLRTHTHGKEMSVSIHGYIYSMCVGVSWWKWIYVCGCRHRMNLRHVTLLSSTSSMVFVLSQGSRGCPPGPLGSPLSCWPCSAWLSCSFMCQPKSITPLRYSMAALLMLGHQSIMYSLIYLKASYPGE